MSGLDDKPKSIYLAGPMRGIPHFNFPRFHAVTSLLRKDGHTVFNPAEKDIERLGNDLSAGNPTGDEKQAANEGFSLRQALAEDCEFICKQADTVMMLPGWEKSNGAQAEQRLAVALQSEGVEIVYLSEPLCVIMEQAAKHFAQQQVEFAERAKAGENALA